MERVSVEQMPMLELVAERKLHELLNRPAQERLEASGVYAADAFLYITLDNAPHIARLARTRDLSSAEHTLFRQRGEEGGYEDIAYSERERRFYLLIEALPFGAEVYKAKIEEYDEGFQYRESRWLDFPLSVENKGLEGLACVNWEGQEYVLGLCEGNKCKGGALGRQPGGGRIQVFQRAKSDWAHVDTLKLPKSVLFEDYASLDVRGERIVVVSQRSSAVWVGRWEPGGWGLVDEGQVYGFPRSRKGNLLYGNVEGVSWLGPNQIVVVSDKAKPGQQPKRCAQKDQCIHVFNIPGVYAQGQKPALGALARGSIPALQGCAR